MLPLVFHLVSKLSMASFTFIATSSTWLCRMCVCGYGHCIVKISKSTKNPRCPYFACPLSGMSAQFINGHNCISCWTNWLTRVIFTRQPYVNWIGWCKGPRRQSTDFASSSTDIVMHLRDDVIHIQQSLRLLKTVVSVLCIVVVIMLLRM